MGLVGQRTGRRWQLGDNVRVKLTRVDLTQRQIDFEFLDGQAASEPRHGARAPRGRGGGGGGGGAVATFVSAADAKRRRGGRG